MLNKVSTQNSGDEAPQSARRSFRSVKSDDLQGSNLVQASGGEPIIFYYGAIDEAAFQPNASKLFSWVKYSHCGCVIDDSPSEKRGN